MSGPLHGVRVVELAGIGPSPHASMILADLGADVVRVVRPGTAQKESSGIAARYTLRGRRLVELDLKQDAGREAVLSLVGRADVLTESMRPGAVDRLGLGAAACLEGNPRLVYAHMTGWGQTGSLATTAGHDINYLAVAGALFPIGTESAPVPPLNLVGDYGGGSLFLVVGVLAALLERERSGRGQEIDVAMVDGASVLVQAILQLRASGGWADRREANLIDGGAPFYRTYECRDGGHLAVGALEPQFYAQLLDLLGLDADTLPAQHDRENWPALREAIAGRVAERSRDEWAAVFDGTDACATPVLTFDEAAAHPHIAARGSLRERDGSIVAAPAPRFSRSTGPGDVCSGIVSSDDVLARWQD